MAEVLFRCFPGRAVRKMPEEFITSEAEAMRFVADGIGEIVLSDAEPEAEPEAVEIPEPEAEVMPEPEAELVLVEIPETEPEIKEPEKPKNKKKGGK